MKKVLIIGGSGFIGSNLVAAMHNNFSVTSISRSVVAYNLKMYPKVKFIEADWQTFDFNAFLAENYFDVILLLACVSHPRASDSKMVFDVMNNVVPAVKVLEAASMNGSPEIIFTSSAGAIYESSKQPLNEKNDVVMRSPYAASKVTIELWLEHYSSCTGSSSVSLRISNPFGPFQRNNTGQGVIPIFIDRAIKGQPLVVYGDGKVQKDYLYIDDLTDAIVNTIETEIVGYQVFNIGSSYSYSTEAVAQRVLLMVENTCSQIEYKTVDFSFPDNEVVLDISKAKSYLNWSPKTDFNDGIKQTFKWISENG